MNYFLNGCTVEINAKIDSFQTHLYNFKTTPLRGFQYFVNRFL